MCAMWFAVDNWRAAVWTLAREGCRPPRIRILLGDPRWEARLLRFIKPSGVRRVVDEVNAEGVGCEVGRLGRMGGGGQGGGIGRLLSTLFFSFVPIPMFRGSHTPGFAHSATLRWRVSLSRLRVGAVRPHKSPLSQSLCLQHHGMEEIPRPPPKKSCIDRSRNALACTVAQTRTRHWRSSQEDQETPR